MACDFFLVSAVAGDAIVCVTINNEGLRKELTWAILQSLVLTNSSDTRGASSNERYQMLQIALAHLPEFAKLEQSIQASKSIRGAAAKFDALFKRCAGASAELAVQCSAWIYTSTRLMQVMPSKSNERWRYHTLRRFTDNRFWEVRLTKVLGVRSQEEKRQLLEMLGASEGEMSVALPLLAQVEKLDQQKIYCGPFMDEKTATAQNYSGIVDDVASRLTCVDLSLGSRAEQQPGQQLWRVARSAWTLGPGRELGMYFESCARAREKDTAEVEQLAEALEKLAMERPRQATSLRTLSSKLREHDWKTIDDWCAQAQNQAAWHQEIAEMQRSNRELLEAGRGEGLKSLEPNDPCAKDIQTFEFTHSAAFLGHDGVCIRLDYVSQAGLVPTARQNRLGQVERIQGSEGQVVAKQVTLPSFGLPVGVVELRKNEEAPDIITSNKIILPPTVVITSNKEDVLPPISPAAPPIPEVYETRSMLLPLSWRSGVAVPSVVSRASLEPAGTKRFASASAARGVEQRTSVWLSDDGALARLLPTAPTLAFTRNGRAVRHGVMRAASAIATLNETRMSQVLRTDMRSLVGSPAGVAWVGSSAEKDMAGSPASVALVGSPVGMDLHEPPVDMALGWLPVDSRSYQPTESPPLLGRVSGERLFGELSETPRVAFDFDTKPAGNRVARWRIWAPVQSEALAASDASIYLTFAVNATELQASRSYLLTQGGVVSVYADEFVGRVVIRVAASQFIGSAGRDVELWLGPEAGPSFPQAPLAAREMPRVVD